MADEDPKNAVEYVHQRLFRSRWRRLYIVLATSAAALGYAWGIVPSDRRDAYVGRLFDAAIGKAQDQDARPAAALRTFADRSNYDIVFVADAGMSMEPYLQAIPAIASAIDQRLRRQSILLRFGITLFTDYDYGGIRTTWPPSPGFPPVRNVLPLSPLSDVDSVKTKLLPTQGGSMTFEGPVFDSIAYVIDATDWTPSGNRAIVLITDGASHSEKSERNPGKLTAQAVVLRAASMQVRLFPVYLGSRSAAQTAEKQYTELSQGVGPALEGRFLNIWAQGMKEFTGSVASAISDWITATEEVRTAQRSAK